MSNFKCKDFEDIGRCFEQLNSNFRSKINSLRSELKGVKEKITAIEGHVEYAQSEFQTLHNETIPAFEDKQMDETNQHLALELWGRKWNLII
jgi:seryl-tRNA synthetase